MGLKNALIGAFWIILMGALVTIYEGGLAKALPVLIAALALSIPTVVILSFVTRKKGGPRG